MRKQALFALSQKNMNFETFFGIGGAFGIILCGLFCALVICGIIMPVVVLFIHYRVSQAEKLFRSSEYTLRLIEHLLRHGKDQTGE